MAETNILLPVSFGEPGSTGEAGPPGPPGPPGPLGSTGFPTAVAGVVTVDPTAKRIESYRSAQSIEGGVAGTGAAAVILQHAIGARNSRLIFQAWAMGVSSGGLANDKVQTVDGAKRVKYNPGGISWTLVASGTDVPDDTDAIGCVFAWSIVNISGTRYVQVTGNVSAAYTMGATITEVW